jgi:hypothetical protein
MGNPINWGESGAIALVALKIKDEQAQMKILIKKEVRNGNKKRN